MLGFVRKRLAGAKDALIFTTLVSLISALIGIIHPAFSRVFVDRLLTGLNPGWVTPFFVLLTVFALIQITPLRPAGILSEQPGSTALHYLCSWHISLPQD